MINDSQKQSFWFTGLLMFLVFAGHEVSNEIQVHVFHQLSLFNYHVQVRTKAVLMWLINFQVHCTHHCVLQTMYNF